MLHVDIPTTEDLRLLIAKRGPAHVTIYLPTTPVTHDTQADRIALKNLADNALEQLTSHDKRERQAIEERLLDLMDDDIFWEYQANSLGIFVTPQSLQTFRLPNHLKPAVEVSDRFLVKPLLRAVTVPQAALVLALAQNSVRLLGITAAAPVFEIKVDGLPTDAASAAGKASIKDRSPSGRIQGSEGMKVRLAQYARKVDQALRDVLSGRQIPLILAAAEPLLSIYRGLATYPHLAATGILSSPETMTDAELAAAARPILDELFRQKLQEFRTLFDTRQGQWRTTTDITQAARAATAGAISHLLVDIDENLPGTVNEEGAVVFAESPCSVTYDIVDEIAARALQTGAQVLGVRKGDIPGEESLAAILRYKF